MLWYNIPFEVNNIKFQIFMEFMYHQLIPEVLEGTMIILKNNHLSEEMMVKD